MRTARQKILSTATRLFYQRGINSVGVDEVVKRSGVAKMTLYKYFPSKDALAAAFLEEIHSQWSDWFFGRVAAKVKSAKTTEERVLGIFDVLEEWFKRPEFRGCPFINTVAEITNEKSAARAAAVAFKQKLLESIREAARPLDPKGERELALQLLLLVDGAVVRATMTDSPHAAKVAKVAAARLMKG